jgi:hypothetical protein
MANPTGHGLKPMQKGQRQGGRKPGSQNLFTRDLKEALLEAAEEVGEVIEEPILGKDGKPTGMTRSVSTGKDGIKGYLKWAAIHRANAFIPQLGRVMPLQVNVRSEEKPVVHYETVEERRKAMIDAGWAPSVLAALEEAMEPKFLRDMREREEGQGEAMIAAAPDMLKALRTIEFDVRGRCTACFGWDGSSENDHKHANDCIVASAIAKATGT